MPLRSLRTSGWPVLWGDGGVVGGEQLRQDVATDLLARPAERRQLFVGIAGLVGLRDRPRAAALTSAGEEESGIRRAVAEEHLLVETLARVPVEGLCRILGQVDARLRQRQRRGW